MDFSLDRYTLGIWEKQKVSKRAVKTEIDSRFAIIPGYSNLWRFARGVFTSTHHWTVHEYKAMMKVAVGIVAVFSISNNRIKKPLFLFVPFLMNLINLNRIKSLERLYSYSIIQLFGEDFIIHYHGSQTDMAREKIPCQFSPRITSEPRRICKARMRSHSHESSSRGIRDISGPAWPSKNVMVSRTRISNKSSFEATRMTLASWPT
jgi:hypothetical protein